MSIVILTILSILALALFVDGTANICSTDYFERRQKFFRLWAQAPGHVERQKYYVINRIIAGLCAIGAGAVVVIWIIEYVGH